MKTFELLSAENEFGLILLILNMIIPRRFTGPMCLLLAAVHGPGSYAVTDRQQTSLAWPSAALGTLQWTGIYMARRTLHLARALLLNQVTPSCFYSDGNPLNLSCPWQYFTDTSNAVSNYTTTGMALGCWAPMNVARQANAGSRVS